jgi:hypothetical protein
MLEINSKNKALKNKLIKQKEAIEKLTKEKIEQEDHITRVLIFGPFIDQLAILFTILV